MTEKEKTDLVGGIIAVVLTCIGLYYMFIA